MSNNNMATLQAHLFDVLQGVKSGAIDVERANAVCAVSQQLINTVKAESDFGHRTGQAVASSMIEVKAPSRSRSATIRRARSNRTPFTAIAALTRHGGGARRAGRVSPSENATPPRLWK